MVRILTVLICLFAALPALAGDGAVKPRLVLGGVDLGADQRSALLTTGGVSLGMVSGGSTADRLSRGGYAAYTFSDMAQLSSSWRDTGRSRIADLALNPSDQTALRLGYEVPRPDYFSPNAANVTTGAFEPYLPTLSLRLSWTHDVTPALSLGGFAGASRPVSQGDGNPDLHVGAGLGVRF